MQLQTHPVLRSKVGCKSEPSRNLNCRARLVGLLLLVVLALLTICVFACSRPRTFNVKAFGAKGDGVSDDYEAMQAAAVALCNAPGATLIYPRGTYRIDRYRITGGVSNNSVSNIRYVGCKGVKIIGEGAKIDVKGEFRRTAGYSDAAQVFSYECSVIPFEMVDSSGFHISGFDINGNVDKMSRDAGVVEGSMAGILTTNCRDYVISDVNVHHFAADGITLGGNSLVADQHVELRNVTSTNNARQGLSVIQVRKAEILNSVFSFNGRTGKYGIHSPAAGVNVQALRRPPEEDAYTGLLSFENCRFEENIGPQFISAWPEGVDSVSVKNSFVRAIGGDTSGTAFMNAPQEGVTSANTFELSAGHSVALAVYKPEQYAKIAHLIYNKNAFRLGDNRGIVAPLQASPVDFVDNDVRIKSPTVDRTFLRLDYLNLVESNHFFVANTGYSGLHYTILFEYGKETIRNNRYETDRTGPGYFDVYYGLEITKSGETFLNPANFQTHDARTAALQQFSSSSLQGAVK
jgi:hypothetical protein